jgi:hypothetical protein
VSKQNEESTGEVSKSSEEEGEKAADTLIESETAAVGKVALDVYLRYFKSIGFLLVGFVSISALSSEASSVLSNCKILFIIF